MLNSVKVNMLIPIKFEKEDYKKIEIVPKDQLCMTNMGNDNQNLKLTEEWFQNCFVTKNIKNTDQLAGSPLLDTDLVRRVKLLPFGRTEVGIYHNEGYEYFFDKFDMKIQIGEIKIIFFKFGIAFIDIEIDVQALSINEVLDLCSLLKDIKRKAKITYLKSTSKNDADVVSFSFKDLIGEIISLQSYVRITSHSSDTYSEPFMLVYMSGDICEDEQLIKFNMLRNNQKSQMSSSEIISEQYLFKPMDYISWIIGPKIVAGFANTAICGEKNLKFVTGGLVQSVSENYLTIYAYFCGIKLLAKEISHTDKDSQKELLLSEVRVLSLNELSTISHINKLFETYLLKNEWDLYQFIKELDEKSAMIEIKNLREEFIALKEFVSCTLNTFLMGEKKKFNESGTKDDEGISNFILNTSTEIGAKLNNSSMLLTQGKNQLIEQFGENWEHLKSNSQTSLISAKVLLESCAEIETENFDYSGICICTTSALETELKRIFFDGLIQFMVATYGHPQNCSPNELYRNWPEKLLILPKKNDRKNNKIQISKEFFMGNLPYLFGKSESYVNNCIVDQSKLMKCRMSEYLRYIASKKFAKDLFENLSINPNGMSFVEKCEFVRDKYRNKAAHIDIVNKKEALACYQYIIGNDNKKGMLLDLHNKIDISKVGSGNKK